MFSPLCTPSLLLALQNLEVLPINSPTLTLLGNGFRPTLYVERYRHQALLYQWLWRGSAP